MFLGENRLGGRRHRAIMDGLKPDPDEAKKAAALEEERAAQLAVAWGVVDLVDAMIEQAGDPTSNYKVELSPLPGGTSTNVINKENGDVVATLKNIYRGNEVVATVAGTDSEGNPITVEAGWQQKIGRHRASPLHYMGNLYARVIGGDSYPVRYDPEAYTLPKVTISPTRPKIRSHPF